MSVMSQMLRVHERLYVASDGRVGHKMLGVPTLLLRTTGRRSGATRTNGLVYARDGADYLVVPSNGGADRAPAWLHNLQADPAVEIQIGRERRPATARVVEPVEPGLRPAVDARQRQQPGPLPGLSGEDGPADPGRRAYAFVAGSGTIRM